MFDTNPQAHKENIATLFDFIASNYDACITILPATTEKTEMPQDQISRFKRKYLNEVQQFQ